MRLLSIAALIGLVRTQQVDFGTLGISPEEILASDPEIDAMLAENESSMNSEISRGRSIGMDSQLEQFGVRQLPPGIELAQLIDNSQFDSSSFLNEQSLTDQALTSTQPAKVTINRPVEVSSSGESHNIRVGNRPSTTFEPSNSVLKTGFNYNRCRICNGVNALTCSNAPSENCGSDDATVCHYTIRQRFGKEPLFYSRCVEQSACMAQVRQNFVARIDGDHPMNRCKGSRLMSSPRFRPHSQCDFCMKKFQSGYDEDNQLFSNPSNLYTDNDATETVAFTMALLEPWTYFASTAISPLGQIYEFTDYY